MDESATGWAVLVMNDQTGLRKYRRPTPEEAERDNDRRLRAARRYFGYVPFRLLPQIRIHSSDTVAWRPTPRHPRKHDQSWNNWGLIRGRLVKIRVDEPVDVLDLLRDLMVFLEAWRPMRARTPEGDRAARSLLEAWKNLARSR